jgi:hypothetical protein
MVMKKIIVMSMLVGFLLLPSMVNAQSNQMTTGAPPVAQPLVPEGDFALKLVPALKLGTPNSEAQAEDMLTSVGITPKNGWIADYPVTPIIIGELQDAIVAASDANKLPMGKDEALNAFQNLIAEFGLAVLPGGSGRYAESQSQPNSTVINNYYYEEGPPVVTYYPPPWDYYYLYAWVPYPFWCSGFFFPGFFVLNDFNIIVVVNFHGHHHHHMITDHFIDPKTHTVLRVDPRTRTIGRTGKTSPSHIQGFNSTEARKGAASIFERSRNRVNSLNGSTTTMGNNAGRNPSTLGRQNEMNSQGGQRKSFQAPNATHERSIDAPSMSNRGGSRSSGPSESSGRTFSAPSTESSGSFGSIGSGRSSGGFSAGSRGGGTTGGFARGGFSGGGGCRGRC